MPQYTVIDGLEKHIITGQKIGESSASTSKKDRWVEMTGFRVESAPTFFIGRGDQRRLALPDGGWITWVVGQSVVAHRPDGCKHGVPTLAGEMSEDIVPCAVCRPRFPFVNLRDPRAVSDEWLEREYTKVREKRDAMGEVMFKVESERHRLYPAVTAAQFVDGVTGDRLSGPAQQLLEEAATYDPDIRAELIGRGWEVPGPAVLQRPA